MPKLGDSDHIVSRRAGGEYKIAGSDTHELSSLTEPEKRRLTTWIVSQRKAGIAVPEITSDVLESIKRGRDMSFSERANQALLFVGTRTRVGGSIAIDSQDSQSREALHDFLALTESTDAHDAMLLMKMLREMELLAKASSPNLDGLFSMTPAGWLRFEELQAKEVKSSQAFVAMWFDLSVKEAYENGIYKAIYDSGYDPRRVDQQHHHLNKVDDEIIAEIRRSRFLVADFTCEKGKVRGSVYFEAGFASGLNIPIIWTCKATSKDDLQFDTRQYPHIVWKDSTDLYSQLKARIGALIGQGPKRGA